MATHAAIVTTAPRAPLEIHRVPTPNPTGNEVLIRNEWTTTGPLELHQADGGLLVSHPQILGDTHVGTIVAIGDDVKGVGLGDKVFGFGWRSCEEKAHQEFSLLPQNLLAKAVTIPTNLVTTFHTLITELGIKIPWPKPVGYSPADRNANILVWGGSSSVGQYVIQVLHYYNYASILTVSSTRQHAHLKSLGATNCFDYSDLDTVVADIREVGHVDYVVDCIGSLPSSMTPLSKIASTGTKVAVMLPVVVEQATKAAPPAYSMDVGGAVPWAKGVEARGVRTHHYLENELLAAKMLPEIMPRLVEMGIVKPNRIRVIQGLDMLDRAQKAMDTIREGVSGEKLVWRIR